MSVTRDEVLALLSRISTPSGGNLVSRDLIRALVVEDGAVRFVIEAPTPEEARSLAPTQVAAEIAVKALAGVTSVSVVTTAHLRRRTIQARHAVGSSLRRAR